MERRDPLREVANTSSNNEPQEAVDDAPKQLDPVAGSSSDNKENGFSRKVQKSDTDKSDIGCGSNKPKETKSRRSVLKTFDPLYSESPERVQAASSSISHETSQPHLVIEESNESESEQTSHLVEVSDDETLFVDACTASDESSEPQVPQNKNLQLEESLLKFYTPEKVHVVQKASDSDSASTSDAAESQSVLLNIETSTSSSDQPHIQQEAICSTSFPLNITESEIVSAIKQISGDCDTIPTRSKFTVSESEQENYNLLRERFSDENTEAVFLSAIQGNAADGFGANSLTSVIEIRNISPERSVAALENANRSNEPFLVEEHQHSENRILNVTETTDKNTSSSDDSEESEVVVIEKRPVVEINLEEKEENIFFNTPKEETEPQSSTDVPPAEEKTTCIEDNAAKDIDKHIEEVVSSETNRSQPEQSEKVQPEKGKDFSSEVKPENQEAECESQLEDKPTENRESFKEEPLNKTEKSEECLESDCGSDIASEQDSNTAQKHIESSCETEVEPNQKLDECQKHLESDCEADFKPSHISAQSQGHLKSDGEEEFRPTEKPANPDLDIDLVCEEKFGGNEGSTEIVKETTSKVESAPSSEEQISEKTEELENTSEIQKSDVLSETETKADDNAYIHQDEEHHLDSGLDSIEESYTKSPKSQVGDSEDSEKGEGEDQEISPDREDSCLTDEKLNHTHDELQTISVDEKDTKIVVDDTTQDEQTQLLDNSKTEEKLDESTEPKIDGSIKNLTDNQKSDIKSSADIDPIIKSKMADLSEKLNEQQQENSDLKLQLNAIQQAKASLELEIRQKEEVIIKTQAEALKNEQAYKQEIKQLREKLKENSKLIEKDGSKELEDQLKEAKAREAKAVAELNQRTKDDLNYQKIMEEYENTIATRFADFQKLKEDHETATRHLANIELAFSDVHQKYERTKALLEGFKSNEEALNAALQASEKTCKQHEERYESLKAHAKGQIEKSNKEILMLRDKYEMDINKLKAIIKRLEIKCSSLEVSLQQKTEECAALSALCDEVTGKKV